MSYGRARLLGGGDVPWASPAELSSFFARIGGMFHSDAVLVDVADVFAQRAAAGQQLRAAMTARSRPGYALRTLLGDEQARGTARTSGLAQPRRTGLLASIGRGVWS